MYKNQRNTAPGEAEAALGGGVKIFVIFGFEMITTSNLGMSSKVCKFLIDIYSYWEMCGGNFF